MLKMLLGAAALTIATPVFAQSTPAADPHAGHSSTTQPATPQAQPSDHAGHEKMDCCKKCGGKDGKAKMDCCDKPKGAASVKPAGH